MFSNSAEYLQANNILLQIMDMIEGKSIFDDLKPVQPSDIVNLSLDLLRIIIQIHAEENRDEANSKANTIRDISESSNNFVRFAEISIDCQRSNNKDLKDVFLALGTADDVEDLITKILVYGKL